MYMHPNKRFESDLRVAARPLAPQAQRYVIKTIWRLK